jgi:hypothetical protein
MSVPLSRVSRVSRPAPTRDTRPASRVPRGRVGGVGDFFERAHTTRRRASQLDTRRVVLVRRTPTPRRATPLDTRKGRGALLVQGHRRIGASMSWRRANQLDTPRRSGAPPVRRACFLEDSVEFRLSKAGGTRGALNLPRFSYGRCEPKRAPRADIQGREDVVMTLRTGHGTGRGSLRVEVLPPDELPAGTPAIAREARPRDRGEAGRFAPGNALARAGGKATAGKSRLASKLGLRALPEGSAFRPPAVSRDSREPHARARASLEPCHACFLDSSRETRLPRASRRLR